MSNIFIWSPLETAANLFTVACIFLAGRNSIHTWWTGLIGCTLFGLLFYQAQLYADATLQVFFFVTGIYGWIMWKTKGSSPTKELEVNRASPQYMATALGIAMVVAAAYGWLLHTYTNAYAPWIDSTVLTFSIVAQLLLMGRSLQNWQVWLLVNTLSVPLFWSRELYLTSVLYSAFWVNAIYSYYTWKKLVQPSGKAPVEPSLT